MQPSIGTSKAPVPSRTPSSPVCQLTKLPATGLFKQLTVKGLVGRLQDPDALLEQLSSALTYLTLTLARNTSHHVSLSPFQPDGA